MARTKRPTNEPEPAVYTIPEAAGVLRLSPDTVRRMIRTGELDAKKFRAQWRIPIAAVDELVRSNGKPTKTGKSTSTKRAPRKAAAAKTTKTTARKR